MPRYTKVSSKVADEQDFYRWDGIKKIKNNGLNYAGKQIVMHPIPIFDNSKSKT